MATFSNITAYDANQALSNPVRSLGPAVKWQEVTTDTDLGAARWLQVTTAGNLDYVAVDGSTVTGFPVVQGLYFMLFTQILSSSTAAGLWWSN